MGVAANVVVHTPEELESYGHGTVIVIQAQGKTIDTTTGPVSATLAMQKVMDKWFPVGVPVAIGAAEFKPESWPVTVVWKD